MNIYMITGSSANHGYFWPVKAFKSKKSASTFKLMLNSRAHMLYLFRLDHPKYNIQVVSKNLDYRELLKMDNTYRYYFTDVTYNITKVKLEEL